MKGCGACAGLGINVTFGAEASGRRWEGPHGWLASAVVLAATVALRFFSPVTLWEKLGMRWLTRCAVSCARVLRNQRASCPSFS
jgi:hypothetical protein